MRPWPRSVRWRGRWRVRRAAAEPARRRIAGWREVHPCHPRAAAIAAAAARAPSALSAAAITAAAPVIFVVVDVDGEEARLFVARAVERLPHKDIHPQR